MAAVFLYYIILRRMSLGEYQMNDEFICRVRLMERQN